MDKKEIIDYLEEIIDLECQKFKLNLFKEESIEFLTNCTQKIFPLEESKNNKLKCSLNKKYNDIEKDFNNEYKSLFEYKTNKENITSKLKELANFIYNKPKYRQYDEEEKYELELENYLNIIDEYAEVEKELLKIDEIIAPLEKEWNQLSEKIKKQREKDEIKLAQEINFMKIVNDYKEEIFVKLKEGLLTYLNDQINDVDTKIMSLYARNIIFPKYRIFHAITNIYEYFVTNRCNELGNAYNIYESESIKFISMEKLYKYYEVKEENQYFVNKRLQEIKVWFYEAEEIIEDLINKINYCDDVDVINEMNDNIDNYINEIITKIF